MIHKDHPTGMLNVGLIPVETDDTHALNAAAQHFVCQHYGYYLMGNDHWDAQQQNGRKTRILTTPWRVKNGHNDGQQAYTHGRFTINDADHDYLLRVDGSYCFLVYETHPDGIIPLYVRETPARVLHDFVIKDDAGGEIVIDEESQVNNLRFAWPTIFPDTGAEL